MSEQQKIDVWLNYLNRQEIPAFAETTKTLAALTRNRNVSAADLAKVILHDTTLASKILRMVNSTLYNPSIKRIDTISHAIVLLGIDRIRNLAITVTFLEDILQPGNLVQVHMQTIIAFQAAVHARRLAELSHVDDPEQVYIAALFQRLGPILFWCFPHNKKEQLIARFGTTLPEDGEEHEVIGFRFETLTQCLIRQWHLTNLIIQDHEDSNQQAAIRCIELAYQAAQYIPSSWQTSPSRLCVEQMCSITKHSFEACQFWLVEGFQIANRGLLTLKVDEQLLRPVAPPESLRESGDAKSPLGAHPHTQHATTSSDSLRLLMHLLNGPIDIEYFQLALLESVRHELTCPTVFILARKGKQQKLLVRHFIGKKSLAIANSLIQFIEQSHIPELERLMSSHFPFFCSNNKNHVSYPENKILGPHYLCFPLMADELCLGYLFALSDSQSPLTEDDFDRFCHYCEHGNLAYRLFFSEQQLAKEIPAIPLPKK